MSCNLLLEKYAFESESFDRGYGHDDPVGCCTSIFENTNANEASFWDAFFFNDFNLVEFVIPLL